MADKNGFRRDPLTEEELYRVRRLLFYDQPIISMAKGFLAGTTVGHGLKWLAGCAAGFAVGRAAGWW